MPTCTNCNNWVYSYDKRCPSCDFVFDNSIDKPIDSPNFVFVSETEHNQHSQNNNISGEVYLLQSDKYYKIGKTTNFEKRFRDIKLQLPAKVICIHRINTNNINMLESHWHKYFKNKRKNGEWFELSRNDVDEFVSQLEVIFK